MGSLKRVRMFDSSGRRSFLIAGKQLHEIPVRVSDERDPHSRLGCVAGRQNRAAARLHTRMHECSRMFPESSWETIDSTDLIGGRSHRLPRLDVTKLLRSRSTAVPKVETSTPPNTPTPIGPYSHIAKVGSVITIGGTAGINPATGELAGPDVQSQTLQILDSFKVMLESVGSDLAHVVHVNIFLKEMGDFEAMNVAYIQRMGEYQPARTVIGVRELPKPGVLLTMNLTAVTID
jgi:2-iminobutanoate/2-iminopropanoate deaminase